MLALVDTPVLGITLVRLYLDENDPTVSVRINAEVRQTGGFCRRAQRRVHLNQPTLDLGVGCTRDTKHEFPASPVRAVRNGIPFIPCLDRAVLNERKQIYRMHTEV